MPSAATWMDLEIIVQSEVSQGLPQGLSGKESACNAGEAADTGLIPGSGGSPGEGYGNPLQYSHQANLTDTGAWRPQSIIVGQLVVLQSQTRLKCLSTHTHLHEVQTERKVSHAITYMWNFKKKIQKNLFAKQNRPTDLENKLLITKGEGGQTGKNKSGDWD